MGCDKTYWEELKKFRKQKQPWIFQSYSIKGQCYKGENKRKKTNSTIAKQFGYVRMDRKAKFWITRFNSFNKGEKFSLRDFYNFRHNYKAAV